MIESMHSYGPFALFAAFMFIGFIWVYVAFPECKGRSMESMDALFSMPWWKVGPASVKKTVIDSETGEVSDDDADLHDAEKQAAVERIERM